MVVTEAVTLGALFSVKYKKNKALQGQDYRWKCGRITIILTLP